MRAPKQHAPCGRQAALEGRKMADEKNDIDKLIDSMIASSNDFARNLKTVLPEPLADSVEMFQQSNVSNLKKIKDFLNKA